MYVQKISIKTDKILKDEIVEEFNLLLNYYRGSSQIIGKLPIQYLNNNNLIAFAYSIEKQSLNKSNNNFYVKKQIQKIEKLLNSIIQFEIKGKTFESYNGGCKCKKSTFYFLQTDYIHTKSPLNCGFCGIAVPLYKIPKYYDYGYMPILSWESNYKSCDTLQMNCEVGEKWALEEMQNLDSELNQQGIEIAKRIEVLTSIPTYYYLYNYNNTEINKNSNQCPSCLTKWDLEKELINEFDFKCDDCRIISTYPSES